MRSYLPAVLAALLVPPGAAHADDLIRKGGEWRSIVTGIGPQPQTMEMCFSQMTLQQAMAKIAAGKQCSKNDIRIDGNIVTIDIACGTMSAQGTAKFTGSDAYTADMTMHLNIGGREKIIHSVNESKWLGPCKPGEIPVN